MTVLVVFRRFFSSLLGPLPHWGEVEHIEYNLERYTLSALSDENLIPAAIFCNKA
jgi:hypothetical protein